MTNSIFHLSTCDTCKRILKQIQLEANDFVLHDIKTAPLTAAQLDSLKVLAGSYEALFSRRAQQYKALRLAEKQLTEADYRHYLLQHYTFLKRPVVVLSGAIYIGSDKKVMDALVAALKNRDQ